MVQDEERKTKMKYNSSHGNSSWSWMLDESRFIMPVFLVHTCLKCPWCKKERIGKGRRQEEEKNDLGIGCSLIQSLVDSVEYVKHVLRLQITKQLLAYNQCSVNCLIVMQLTEITGIPIDCWKLYIWTTVARQHVLQFHLIQQTIMKLWKHPGGEDTLDPQDALTWQGRQGADQLTMTQNDSSAPGNNG